MKHVNARALDSSTFSPNIPVQDRYPAGGATIDPTGIISRIAPNIHYPGQWPNECWNNVISSNGLTLTAYWLGSHPDPINALGQPEIPAHYASPASDLSLGTWLGCASVPAAGLFTYFTTGFSFTKAVIAGGIAAAASHDDVSQCAAAFGDLATGKGYPTFQSMVYGTDDMTSITQGMMQASPGSGYGGEITSNLMTGPDPANGPGGGTNDGSYWSGDGIDLGGGGTGSQINVDYNVDVVRSGASGAGSFILNSNIGA